ncbi:MAG: hypothetical protein SW019_22220 [Actinomycetota bacterium]|nr:hypothetical protein [Actinomycetota bacterium]
MDSADQASLLSGLQAVRATAGALVGQIGDLLGTGETFNATLAIDGGADVPAAKLLRPGSSHPALVRVGPDRPGSAVRSLCLKVPEAYGPGRDQDFVLVSSGDGAPMHHAALPTAPVAPLYSSLWLYLAGLTPVLFGVRPATTGPDVRFGAGDVLGFALSAPVGQFRVIGSLTLTDPHDEPVRFAARNSGGNLRPLPPVLFY